MILDRIIELELKFLSERRVPTRVLLNVVNYNLLIKELEENRLLDAIHNMKIEIVNSAQLIVI